MNRLFVGRKWVLCAVSSVHFLYLATMWWKRLKKMDGITQRTEVMYRWGATVRKRGEQDKEQMRNLFID